MNKILEEQWIGHLREYCRSLNISTGDLYKIVTDLKVSPMIRGKAFEFSTYSRLKQILPAEEWTVTKPVMNAQTGTHDIDLMVKHNLTGKVISVECKLARKGGFRVAKKAKLELHQKTIILSALSVCDRAQLKLRQKLHQPQECSLLVLKHFLLIAINIAPLVLM